jgi:predicted HicB family RNase H-like nuclease
MDINGQIVFNADSVDSLRAAFRDAVDDYLKHCLDIGRVPEKPYSGKFSVRISPDLRRRVVRFPSLNNTSINCVVTEALEEKIGKIGGNGASNPKPTPSLPVRRHPAGTRKTDPAC